MIEFCIRKSHKCHSHLSGLFWTDVDMMFSNKMISNGHSKTGFKIEKLIEARVNLVENEAEGDISLSVLFEV